MRLVPATGALLLGAVVLGAAVQRPAARPRSDDRWSFVVLGHLRGGRADRLNPKITEVIERVRALHPEFAVLTGDIVWGDVDSNPSRPAVVEDEWNAVDSALNTLGIPLYRVPGNHDVNDLNTRDIWLRRYGPLPKLVTHRNVRLLLLSSSFFPPDGDSSHMTYIGGVDLDSAQVGFIRRALADSGGPTFAFTHHTLWWEPDSGRWWREVHPLLAAAHVRNVFSGDYGPMKFSTKAKDGIRYYQGSIELQVPVQRLQRYMNSRLLSSQLDVFFEVQVMGDSTNVVVHPVAEVSSGDFTPERWRLVNRGPPPTLRERVSELLGNKRRLTLLAGGSAFLLVVGFLLGWVIRGARARRAA